MGRDEHPDPAPVWSGYEGDTVREPSFSERRALFEMAVVKVATSGRP